MSSAICFSGNWRWLLLDSVVVWRTYSVDKLELEWKPNTLGARPMPGPIRHVILFVASLFTSITSAATFDLAPVDQGQFSRSLSGFSFSLNESIIHDASSTQVVISNGNMTGPPPLFSQNARLNAGYLIFDLSSVGNREVTAAELTIDWTGAAFDYNVNQFSNDPILLDSDYNDSGFPLLTISKNLVNDLVGGASYAAATSSGNNTLGLNGQAVVDINGRSGGSFVLGLFGGDGSFAVSTMENAVLRVTTIPEPSSLSMLFAVSAVVVFRRRS